MTNCQQKYVELMSKVQPKYAAWDPEQPVRVGDYGLIPAGAQHTIWPFSGKIGEFMKEGNIYDDGKAEKYGIPQPMERQGGDAEGRSCIMSGAVKSFDTTASLGS